MTLPTSQPLQPVAPSPGLLAQEPQALWRAGPDASSQAVGQTVGQAVSQGAVALLGGRRAMQRWPRSRAEIHQALVQGLPGSVLIHLLDQLAGLPVADVAAVLGLSSRTLHRLREQPAKLLAPDLASKAWHLAELLAQAARVFGDAAAAQRWLVAPAMGLDGARPIALLRTLQGSELVLEFLGRLEAGVYN